MTLNRNQLMNDRETVLRVALDGRQAQMWTAIPGIVVAVDLTAMTLQVRPAIQGIVTDQNGAESFVDLPLLVDVPICFPSAGGFLLAMPIAVEDEVLVVFSSRCIDSWWQNGGVGVPMEMRMHDLSDGFAIPGPRSQTNLPGGAISSTSAQLRNDAGTAYVGINAANKIQIYSPTKNMKGVLNGMLDLLTNLETALTTFSTGLNPGNLAANAATLAASLATLSTAITTYKTSDVGALLE